MFALLKSVMFTLWRSVTATWCPAPDLVEFPDFFRYSRPFILIFSYNCFLNFLLFVTSTKLTEQNSVIVDQDSRWLRAKRAKSHGFWDFSLNFVDRKNGSLGRWRGDGGKLFETTNLGKCVQDTPLNVVFQRFPWLSHFCQIPDFSKFSRFSLTAGHPAVLHL